MTAKPPPFVKKIKILSWNVQGLRKKLGDIRNYLMNFEIILLTETWIESKQIVNTQKMLPKEFTWFWMEAVREKQRGRPAGGMTIGVKNGIPCSGFTGNSKGCWASINIAIKQHKYKILSIYNNTSCDTMRVELEQVLEQCRSEGYAGLLCGDLNARIGTLGAHEENEERATEDAVINKEGREWITLMETYGLTLLNGNVNGDRTGNITRMGYSNQEQAVLDYAAITTNSFQTIDSMKVGVETNSDHFPLEISLKESIVSENQEPKIRQSWRQNDKLNFKERLINSGPANGWNEVHKKLWEATNKRRVQTVKEKEWWNEKCFILRKEMWDVLAMVRAGVREVQLFREAKRAYKVAIKEAKELHDNKIRQELDRVTSVNEGWKFIKKYKYNAVQSVAAIKEPMQIHFKQLLQGEEEEENDIPSSSLSEHPALTEAEFTEALRLVKENKAAGPDNLKGEAFIHADAGTKEELRLLLENILNGGAVPSEWCEATIIPIYKKGDPLDPGNYRGIAIGNVIYKLLAIILNRRLQQHVEDRGILPDTQNGFRSGRSTVDNVAILTQAIHQCIGKRKSKLFALFVDFKTAFDLVNRRLLIDILRRQGIPDYLIESIKRMYNDTSYIIEGEKFRSHRGLKQGCPLSPLLFALYIADLDRTLERNQLGGVLVGRRKIFCLAFADDLIIMAYSAAELKDMIRALQRFANKRQLLINAGKSKVMTFNKGSRSSGIDWKIGGQVYDEVDQFLYLGVVFQRNGEFTRHHDYTYSKANRRATEVWSLAERLFPFSYATRMQMYNSLVIPVILYAAEVTGYGDCEDYERIQRRYTKWTLGLPKGTRNAVVEREAGLPTITSLRLMRAVNYESRVCRRSSPLTREALTETRASEELTTRRRRWNGLGWSVQEVAQRLDDQRFVETVRRRVLDQTEQERSGKLSALNWYLEPKGLLPSYLHQPHKKMKMIARFRCGAESRSTEGWRTSDRCRMCNAAKETLEHMMECIGDRWFNWRQICAEDGGGLHLMERILELRRELECQT